MDDDHEDCMWPHGGPVAVGHSDTDREKRLLRWKDVELKSKHDRHYGTVQLQLVWLIFVDHNEWKTCGFLASFLIYISWSVAFSFTAPLVTRSISTLTVEHAHAFILAHLTYIAHYRSAS